MNETRSQVFQTNSKNLSLSTELEYADDSDFPFESKNEAEHLKRIVKETNAKKYRGIQRITLPVKLHNDIVEGNF